MSVELKLEAKTLAEEARIYRQEELKLKRKSRVARDKQLTEVANKLDKQREWAHNWRTVYIRFDARVVNLARGFLKGLDYTTVENSTKTKHKEMMNLASSVASTIQDYAKIKVELDEVEKWMLLEKDDDDQKFLDELDLSWLFEKPAMAV